MDSEQDKPQSPEEAFQTALAHHRAGRLDEADSICRALLEANPRNPNALNLSGLIAYRRQDPMAALTAFSSAIAVNPTKAAVHCNMGGAFRALGRLEEAVEAFEHALAIDPDNKEARHNIAVVLRELDRNDEAEAHARQLSDMDEGSAEALNQMGLALQAQGKFEEAQKAFEKAIAANDDLAASHRNLGMLLIQRRRYLEALDRLHAAEKRGPQDPETRFGLGRTLLRLNRLEEGEQELRRAVDLNPRHTEAWVELAGLLNRTERSTEAEKAYRQALAVRPDHPRALYGLSRMERAEMDIEAIQHLTRRPDRSISDICHYHCAAGEYLARKGDTDQAFTHFKAANDLRLDELRRRGLAFDTDSHVRTVEAMIAALPKERFEKSSGGAPTKKPVFLVGVPQSGVRVLAEALGRHKEIVVMGDSNNLSQLAGAVANPVTLEGFDPTTARRMADGYLGKLEEGYPGAKRLVDATPSNYLRLGLAAMLFPEARIIHVHRNAMDCCLWSYMRNIGLPRPFSHDLVDLGRYYIEYERLMAFWQLVLPNPFHSVTLEAMATEPDVTLRSVLRFLDLDWTRECTLDMRTLHGVRTSVGRWRDFQDHLEPLMRALSGEFDMPKEAPPPPPAPVIEPEPEPPVERASQPSEPPEPSSTSEAVEAAPPEPEPEPEPAEDDWSFVDEETGAEIDITDTAPVKPVAPDLPLVFAAEPEAELEAEGDWEFLDEEQAPPEPEPGPEPEPEAPAAASWSLARIANIQSDRTEHGRPILIEIPKPPVTARPPIWATRDSSWSLGALLETERVSGNAAAAWSVAGALAGQLLERLEIETPEEPPPAEPPSMETPDEPAPVMEAAPPPSPPVPGLSEEQLFLEEALGEALGFSSEL